MPGLHVHPRNFALPKLIFALLDRSYFASQEDYDTWNTWGRSGVFLQVLQAHTVLYKGSSDGGFRTRFAVIQNVSCVPSTERVRTTDIAEQDIRGLSFANEAVANVVHFSVPPSMIGRRVKSFEVLGVPREVNPGPGNQPRQPSPEVMMSDLDGLYMDAEIHTSDYIVQQCVQNNRVFNGGRLTDISVDDVSYAQTITVPSGQRMDVFKIRYSLEAANFVITDSNVTLTLDSVSSGSASLGYSYDILIPVTDAPISQNIDLRGNRSGSLQVTSCNYLPQLTGNANWLHYLVQLNVE